VTFIEGLDRRPPTLSWLGASPRPPGAAVRTVGAAVHEHLTEPPVAAITSCRAAGKNGHRRAPGFAFLLDHDDVRSHHHAFPTGGGVRFAVKRFRPQAPM
jgi:hypothetical protein